MSGKIIFRVLLSSSCGCTSQFSRSIGQGTLCRAFVQLFLILIPEAMLNSSVRYQQSSCCLPRVQHIIYIYILSTIIFIYFLCSNIIFSFSFCPFLPLLSFTRFTLDTRKVKILKFYRKYNLKKIKKTFKLFGWLSI